jgi:hypothetical protein
MDVKGLRISSLDDPAFVTAVQAAAAEAESGPELERLLRSRGWPVEVVELSEPGAIDEPAVDVRRLDTGVSSRS